MKNKHFLRTSYVTCTNIAQHDRTLRFFLKSVAQQEQEQDQEE